MHPLVPQPLQTGLTNVSGGSRVFCSPRCLLLCRPTRKTWPQTAAPSAVWARRQVPQTGSLATPATAGCTSAATGGRSWAPLLATARGQGAAISAPPALPQQHWQQRRRQQGRGKAALAAVKGRGVTPWSKGDFIFEDQLAGQREGQCVPRRGFASEWHQRKQSHSEIAGGGPCCWVPEDSAHIAACCCYTAVQLRCAVYMHVCRGVGVMALHVLRVRWQAGYRCQPC
jgi:hypothetical protein